MPRAVISRAWRADHEHAGFAPACPRTCAPQEAALRVASVVLAVLALLAPGEVGAHRRELELTRVNEHPIWAGVVAGSLYNPDSSAAGTSPYLTLGLRYVKPSSDESFDFTAVEFAVSELFSDTEDLRTFELDFLAFLPRTRLVTFDNHLFYGVGLGTTFVEQTNTPRLTLPIATGILGLQSRVNHFDVEGSIRIVFAPKRGVYDASGTIAQFSIVYPLDP
jgi:hypothetical protein